jgi:predicted amidohydrolase YtcJ
MVTRRDWDGKPWGANQRVTADEAIRITTLNGAYASRKTRVKGIDFGKLADFVIAVQLALAVFSRGDYCSRRRQGPRRERRRQTSR